jgi:DNA polymerase
LVAERASSGAAPLRQSSARCDAPQVIFIGGGQPENQEDLQGRPFVGPAGRELDSALEQAGINRSAVDITNVVKHFKRIR